MIQNSLPRLLEGIAQSLHDTVLPNVADSFARGQTLAAIELLRNLASRTQWGDDDARAEAQRLVVSLAAQSGDTSGDLLARLRAHVDDELSRTRSGMFSSPTAAKNAGDKKADNTKSDNDVTGAKK
jgi:hypothetical protein